MAGMGKRETDLAAAYRRLGLAPGAEPRAVRKARLDLVRRFHPDRLAGRGDAGGRDLDRHLAEINAAFDLIKAEWARPAANASEAQAKAALEAAMRKAVREAARRARAERLRKTEAERLRKAEAARKRQAAAEGASKPDQESRPPLSPEEMGRARRAMAGFLAYRAGFASAPRAARGRVSHRT